MKTRLFIALLLSTFSFAIISCDLAGPRPIPTPTPTPMPVELCYDLLLKDRDLINITRLEELEGEDFRCVGEITEIRDNGRVQFHIKKLDLAEDQYVECEFSRIEEVRRLNRGVVVAFKGVLDEAFPNRVPLVGRAGKNSTVKFKDCTLI